jgi:hypothetical protein
MPTTERLKAEVLDAIMARAHLAGNVDVEKEFFPETQRYGYRLTIATSIVIDKQHLEAL